MDFCEILKNFPPKEGFYRKIFFKNGKVLSVHYSQRGNTTRNFDVGEYCLIKEDSYDGVKTQLWAGEKMNVLITLT